MTQRNGKFTRGPCEAIDGKCFHRPPPGHLQFVPIISPTRTRDAEAVANASMLAAALNAATTAKGMGYNGQAAVEELPMLLATLLDLRRTDVTDHADAVACVEWMQNLINSALASCRAKESGS